AARGAKVEIVHFFLDLGVHIDVRNERGQTALHSAAGPPFDCSRVLVVQTLLELGAGIEERDAQGRTALQLAAYSGIKDVVEVLLKRGADVNA
ncbi:ankyrin repeat-containing domain protein, partial [Vararia minispora EC-137]